VCLAKAARNTNNVKHIGFIWCAFFFARGVPEQLKEIINPHTDFTGAVTKLTKALRIQHWAFRLFFTQPVGSFLPFIR
jgi:hypothetical protein